MCFIKAFTKKGEKTTVESVWLWRVKLMPQISLYVLGGGGRGLDWEVGVKGPVVVCDRGGISSWRVFCAPLAVSKVMCPGC